MTILEQLRDDISPRPGYLEKRGKEIADPELDPCPFDQGTDVVSGELTQDGAVLMGYVRCKTCAGAVRGPTREAAKELWNSNTDIDPPPEPETDSEYRFVPTHIMACDVGSGGGGVDGVCDQIESLAPYPQFGCASVLLNWDDIEPSTRGVYDRTITDRYVAAAKSVNKHINFGIKFQWFGGPTNWEGKLPAYLATLKGGKPAFSQKKSGETWNGNLTLYVWLHDQETMDCFLGANHALAEWYKDDPTVYLINFGETAVDAPSSSGFSTDKFKTQLKRWTTETEKYWPHNLRRMMTNYLGDNEHDLNEVMDHNAAHHCGNGGPDNYSRSYSSNVLWNGHKGGNDRRGDTLWVSENQRPASSSGGTEATTQQVIDHNWNDGNEDEGGSMGPHNWVWNRNGDGSGGAETWPKIRDTVIANPNKVNTTNPYT